jgi:FixJ family two-component response regulator
MSSSDQRALHLVDDDPAVRRSVGFMLKTSGYQVQSYETGVDLLKAAGDLANGCVLPDIRMPGMDGLEVQEMLQQKGVTLPVVIMTGHGDVALAVRAMKAGVVDFVEKPFKKATLLSSLERLQSTFAQGSFGRAETRRRSPIAGPHPTRARPCSTASRMAYRTKRSPTTSASARVRSKFIARIS